MSTTIYKRILFLAALSLAVIMVIVRLLLAFSYAPDTGGVSVNIVYGISHLAETGKLYTNPEEPPFAIIQYTPFHYYTVYHLACLMGIEHNVYGLLVVNRLFCLTLSLLYCILLGFATLRLYPGIGRQIATLKSLPSPRLRQAGQLAKGRPAC